jgi:3-oxoacyl-[acyl-carrier protein] reductase
VRRLSIFDFSGFSIIPDACQRRKGMLSFYHRIRAGAADQARAACAAKAKQSRGKGVTMQNGKTALVTGASGQGMGRSIALTLVRDGYAVALNYRKNAAAAEDIACLIHKQGGRAVTVQGDVFKQEDCQRLVEATVSAFGGLDVCVIGPGADWNPEPIAGLKPEKALRDVLQEVAPIYYLLAYALGEMRKNKRGRIIGIASNLAIPSPSYAYNAAKAARTEALKQAVSAAWKMGVTVNIIAPGPVNPFANLEDAEAFSAHTGKWDTRGGVTPQDIAEGVAFLCSDAGRYITGCVVPYMF